MSLEEHLATSGLAGRVATPVGACVENAHRLVAGDPDCTFGLSDWRRATVDDVIAALFDCGVDLETGAEDPSALPWVDPAVAAGAVERQRRILAEVACSRGRVLLGTGHAFALLPHYAAIARALAEAGCEVLRPLDAARDRFSLPDGRSGSVRYFDGVGSLIVHGNLLHSHRPDYMEAMLEAIGGPAGVDGVVGDHGYAGAAIEAGIPTVSIADVNDPALPLAQWRGRSDGVLVVDDGLAAPAYEPLTAAVLAF
ncbi:MAG TPA: phosphatase [Acidimicrobiales bacterium]